MKTSWPASWQNSTGFDRLFAKSRLDSEIKRPPLPLSIGQVGLIGGSGLINGRWSATIRISSRAGSSKRSTPSRMKTGGPMGA